MSPDTWAPAGLEGPSAGQAGQLGVALTLETDDLLRGEVLGPRFAHRRVVGLPQRVDAADGLAGRVGANGRWGIIRYGARALQAVLERRSRRADDLGQAAAPPNLCSAMISSRYLIPCKTVF